MTKLCPRGKAAAKRKFKVYPSAYANAYASKICAGKIKDPSGTKRKDWGPKKMNKGGGADFDTSETRIKPYGKTNKVKIQELKLTGYALPPKSGQIKKQKKQKPFYRREAKVGMAVTAGAQSGMGRLQKSGLMKAKKGKMMIMIAIGKPKKANTGVYIEAPKPPRRIKGKGPQRFSTEYIKKKRAYDTLVGNDRKRKRMSDPRLKSTPPQMKNGGDIIKKVATKLEKASRAHAGQAKTLKSLKLSRGGGAAIRGMNFKGVY